MQCLDTRQHPGITAMHHVWFIFSVGHTCVWLYFLLRELGRQRSTIELDTPCMKPAQLQALEEAVNEKIRAHIPVNVQLLSIDDPAVEKVCLLSFIQHTKQSCKQKHLNCIGEESRPTRWSCWPNPNHWHWGCWCQHVLWNSCIKPQSFTGEIDEHLHALNM